MALLEKVHTCGGRALRVCVSVCVCVCVSVCVYLCVCPALVASLSAIGTHHTR